MSGRVVHIKDNVEGAVYIGRAMSARGLSGSKWANPYKIGEHGTRIQVLALYADDLRHDPGFIRQLPELRDKPLACWCRHDGETPTEGNRCHGDILLEWLKDYTDDELRNWMARL